MSTGPADDDAGDIDPADLDDLGDLGDGDEDGDDEKDDKSYVAPTKEQYDKLQRKIARQEAAITVLKDKGPKGRPVRDVDRQLKAQLDAESGKDVEPEDDGQADHWKNVAITNAAAAQISAAGFTGSAKQAARLANLIDRTGIEADRHGAFDLEDEIDELKEEYPQLFAQPGDNRRTPRVRTARTTDDPPKKDATTRTSDAMLRSAGYPAKR